MDIIKKIFITIFIFIFTLSSLGGLAYAENSYEKYLVKDIIVKKQAVSQLKSGDKIVKKLDAIILKLEKKKDAKEKLTKLQSKVWKLQDKYYSISNTTKGKKIFAILNYINAKVNLALYKIRQKELEEIAKLKKQQEEKAEQKLKEMLSGENISNTDKEKIEEKLTTVQLNLFNKAEDTISNLTKEFEKYTSYEEKGSFNINLLIDADAVGKIKAEFEAKDYTYKANMFDGQFTSKLRLLIDSKAKGQDEFNAELESFIDYIQKNGNIYLLLKELKIIDESQKKEIQVLTEKFKELAKKNKYIKIEDKDTKEILEALKNINISKIESDTKEVLENPLLTAYKKEGEKYYLIPTKYACNKYKEVMYKFDPWNGKVCSDSQYEKLLKEMAKAGDLYITLGDENKLVFNAYPSYGIKSFNSELIFTDKEIKEFNSKLIVLEENQGFELSYKKNEKLNFDLSEGKNTINFKSILNAQNKFKTIDFALNIQSFNDKATANFKLANKRFNGKYTYTGKTYAGYDEKTWKSIYLPVKYEANISGTQDTKYNIKDLSLKYKQTNTKDNKDYLTFNFNKQSKNYNISILSNSLKTGDKQFSTDLSIKNKNIYGKTIAYNQGKEVFLVTHSGKYDTRYLKLNNKVELAEPLSNLYTGASSKARDSSRIYSLISLQGAIEQYYQDNTEYPETLSGTINDYIYSIPKDPLGNVEINGCKFGYYYEVGDDENGIENQAYKLSACLENTEKAKNDGGTDDKKYERSSGKIVSNKKGYYINGYTTWTKKEIEEDNTKAISNINFEIDTRVNKNNIFIHIDYSEDNKKMLEYNIEHKATIDYNKKPEIKAPSNYINQSELDIKY